MALPLLGIKDSGISSPIGFVICSCFLLGDPPNDAKYRSCIREARQLLDHDWEVLISHIYREDNSVADLLAHHEHSVDFGFHILSSLPRPVLDKI
ncbi:hypothetical protein LINGRAHAP2_LOCUS1733 [Linum grandiflorum]